MKHIFDTEYLQKHLKEIFEAGKGYFRSEEGLGFLKSILIYLFSTGEFETEKIINIVDKILKGGGELVMTTAMKLKEEGIKEGIREGIKKTALKMLKKGYSIKEICEVTGLKQAEVEALKENE